MRTWKQRVSAPAASRTLPLCAWLFPRAGLSRAAASGHRRSTRPGHLFGRSPMGWEGDADDTEGKLEWAPEHTQGYLPAWGREAGGA
eukprot:8738429-Alexandrium_andersonii.AAC.1